ncbi:hypothetical protein Tco_1513977, partial [Tanacetum coccineum]
MLKGELGKLRQEKESNQLKIKNFDNASKSLDKLIRSQITDNSRNGVVFVSYNAVPPPHTGLFSPPKLDLSNSGLEEESPIAPLVEELVSDKKLEKKTAFPIVDKREFAHPSAHRNMAPRAVLMKTGIRPLNTAKPINTAHPKTTVYSARPMSHFSKSAQSTCHPQKEDQGYVYSGCSRHMT